MNDLLMYIDQIDQSVSNAEISVLESLIQSYDKSIMIIQESSDDTDLSAFDVFQEGEKWDKFKEDTKAPVLGKKGESVAKRILMALPRLIGKLISIAVKFFSNLKSDEKKMNKDIRDLENMAKESDNENNNVNEYMTDNFDNEDIIQESLFKKKQKEEPKKEHEQKSSKRPAALYADETMYDRFEQVLEGAFQLYDSSENGIGKWYKNDIKNFDYNSLDFLLFEDKANYRQKDYKYKLENQLESAEEFAKEYTRRINYFTKTINEGFINYLLRSTDHINIKGLSSQDKRRYLNENIDQIKKIRDSINELHRTRLSFIKDIKKIGEYFRTTWDKWCKGRESRHAAFEKSRSEQKSLYEYSGEAAQALDQFFISTSLYKTSSAYLSIVNKTTELNQTIANCWNAMIRYVRGEHPKYYY